MFISRGVPRDRNLFCTASCLPLDVSPAISSRIRCGILRRLSKYPPAKPGDLPFGLVLICRPARSIPGNWQERTERHNLTCWARLWDFNILRGLQGLIPIKPVHSYLFGIVPTGGFPMYA